jgi:hypothetical protein
MNPRAKIENAISQAEGHAESEAVIDSIGPSEDSGDPLANWPDEFESGLDKDGVFGPPTPRLVAPEEP